MSTKTMTVEIKGINRVREKLAGMHRKRPSMAAVEVWQEWLGYGRVKKIIGKDETGQWLSVELGNASQLVGSYHAHAALDRLGEFRNTLNSIQSDFINEYEAALEPSVVEKSIDEAMQKATRDMMKRTDEMLLARWTTQPPKRTTFIPDWRQDA